VSLLGSFAIPLRSLSLVLWDTLASLVHHAKIAASCASFSVISFPCAAKAASISGCTCAMIAAEPDQS
jgi:hypothetical protein